MALLQARTTLAQGATQTVTTDGSPNFVINVESGQVTVEAFIDRGAPSGYEFKVKNRPVVVAAAAKIIVTGRGKDGGVFEVYAS